MRFLALLPHAVTGAPSRQPGGISASSLPEKSAEVLAKLPKAVKHISATRKVEAGDTSGQHILNYPHGLFSSREKESAVCPSSALTARRKLLVPLLGRITANSQEEKAVEHTPHPIGMNESHRARLANDADPPEPWRQSQGPKASPSPRSRPAPGVQLFRGAQGKNRAGGLWGASQKRGCWYNRLSPLWCRGTAGWGVFSKSGAQNKALEYTWVSGEVGACSCCWSWEAVFCLAAGTSTLWLQCCSWSHLGYSAPALGLNPPDLIAGDTYPKSSFLLMAASHTRIPLSHCVPLPPSNPTGFNTGL